MIGDGGYQGTGPITPHKKPPGGERTAKQKSYNYSINRLRAAVERASDYSAFCGCMSTQSRATRVARYGIP